VWDGMATDFLNVDRDFDLERSECYVEISGACVKARWCFCLCDFLSSAVTTIVFDRIVALVQDAVGLSKQAVLSCREGGLRAYTEWDKTQK